MLHLPGTHTLILSHISQDQSVLISIRANAYRCQKEFLCSIVSNGNERSRCYSYKPPCKPVNYKSLNYDDGLVVSSERSRRSNEFNNFDGLADSNSRIEPTLHIAQAMPLSTMRAKICVIGNRKKAEVMGDKAKKYSEKNHK